MEYNIHMLVPPFQRLNHLYYHWRMPPTPTDCTTLKFYTISNGERLRKVEPTLPKVVLGSWKEVNSEILKKYNTFVDSFLECKLETRLF